MFKNEISFNKIELLPDVTAVYAVYNDETLLYIGSTFSLKKRIKTHHKMVHFVHHKACIIKWNEYDYIEKARQEEIDFICKLKPALNVRMNDRRIATKNVNVKMEYRGESSLEQAAYNLLWEHIERHRTQRDAFYDISENTGLGISWLKCFSEQKSKSASVDRVQTLYEFLSGNDLGEMNGWNAIFVK